jgi:ferredoxin
VFRIEIDGALCSGFGVCAELAPDVVEVGRDGIATARTGMTDDPSVFEAAAACPMAAITVVEEEAA